VRGSAAVVRLLLPAPAYPSSGSKATMPHALRTTPGSRLRILCAREPEAEGTERRVLVLCAETVMMLLIDV
jgi:hypothetical protein